MPIQQFLPQIVVAASLLLSTAASHAQAPAIDSARRPAPLVLKAGLRLTHLNYAHDNKSWQFLVPLSLGAEYRLAPAYSLYGLLEADMLASPARTRRRTTTTATVPNAMLSFGVRHYYGRPPVDAQRTSTEFGRYLALDGSAEWQQLATTARRRLVPATLTPAVYALWGMQNRLRRHVLYDLNAGLGLLAPAHYYYIERASGTTPWNVGAQINIRLFISN